MTDALEDAWQALESSGVDPHLANAVKRMLATFILKIASAGEWDRIQLRKACLSFLSQPGSGSVLRDISGKRSNSEAGVGLR